jgi:2-dehydro-3-deoxyphosphogluconate aldolase/(4S)-4-hydroxy-2-oxoglutarate aldolase
MTSSERLRQILEAQPVIPVLRIERAEYAVPLARALARGGLPAVEITLRTSQALDAIRDVAADVPEAVVGAGTILNPKHFEQAVEAGATFIVSPGQTPTLFDLATQSPVPLLPGATTASEVMSAAERGYDILKFFPAEQAGGAAFLKALASPFAGTRFCPTGGISAANASTYLGLPNVVCVGGSWVAPDALVEAGAWDQITALAAEAAKLRKH